MERIYQILLGKNGPVHKSRTVSYINHLWNRTQKCTRRLCEYIAMGSPSIQTNMQCYHSAEVVCVHGFGPARRAKARRQSTCENIITHIYFLDQQIMPNIRPIISTSLFLREKNLNKKHIPCMKYVVDFQSIRSYRA